jgi:hypothetical protein
MPMPNRFFVTGHGPCDRSRKIGCRVTMVTSAGEVRYEPFAQSRLQG